MKNLRHWVVALIGLQSASFAAVAQDAGPGESKGAGLEEIIVTATRRSEDVQRIPVATTAITADAMSDRSLSNLVEVGRFIPNVDMTPASNLGGGELQVFIRGVGQNDFSTSADGGVGIYVDGVYLARPVGAILDLLDLERIEVLRGPQGTLFGKNALGGAVSVVTRVPDGTFGGQVEATVGERNYRDLRGTMNLPVSSSVALGVAISSKADDGYGTTLTGRSGAVNETAGRASLAITLSDAASLRLSADFTQMNNTAPPKNTTAAYPNDPQASFVGLYNGIVGLANSLNGTSFAEFHPVVPSNLLHADSEGNGKMLFDGQGTSATLDVDLGWADLKSITAYRSYDADVGSESDNTPGAIVTTRVPQRQNQLSQELQLSGSGDKGSWVTGAYYLRERSNQIIGVELMPDLYSALESLPGAIVPLGPWTCPGGPACAGGAGNPVNLALNLSFLDDFKQELTSLAAFVDGTYKVTPKLSLGAGARYTSEKKEVSFTNAMMEPYAVLYAPPDADDTWTDLALRANLTYQFREQLMGYLSYSEGFKSGGFNGRKTGSPTLLAYDPELLTAYEVGLKSQWLDNRLRVNATAFFYDYSDLQLTTFDSQAVVTAIINAGDAEVYGGELEIGFAPTRRLLISANLGYTHGEYTSVLPGTVVTKSTKLQKTPEWTSSGAMKYTLPLGNGALSLQGDLTYSSETQLYISGPPNRDDLLLVGARIQYTDDAGWYVAAHCKNCSNELYAVGGYPFPSFGFDYSLFGPTRMVGITVGAKF